MAKTNEIHPALKSQKPTIAKGLVELPEKHPWLKAKVFTLFVDSTAPFSEQRHR